MRHEASLPTPAAGEQRPRASYLTLLLTSAPAAVRERLSEIGEFTLGEQNLAGMRGRQLRDPGTPSGAVEHADHLVPGGPGDPAVPGRLHRERGITEPRPCLISIHGGGYVIGSHLGDDSRFGRWSPTLRCIGVSVGYLSGLRPGPDIPGFAVPARATELAGLPPAFITVGNLDGLLDEDVEYAQRLIAAGVPNRPACLRRRATCLRQHDGRHESRAAGRPRTGGLAGTPAAPGTSGTYGPLTQVNTTGR